MGNTLQLGTAAGENLLLDPQTLQRHFACFGSSGSGKTVACKVMIEELARNGIPVIAFDPQGDIASLALAEEKDKVVEAGVDAELSETYTDNTEVVIWTPGSSKGLPICINPLKFDNCDAMSSEDRLRFFSATAKNIASLVGYDLTGDDGKSAETVLSVIFEHSMAANIKLPDFTTVINILKDIPEAIADTIGAVANTRFIEGMIKKLSLLTLGARRLLFQNGMPADIDALLGLDGSTDKTRISIIYLNTLHTTEEKEFFIGSIAQQLYNWMLKHPLKSGQEGIQCGMFIDEVAPYIPPVKRPACKESLELLFRQGRKYGVSCLLATQTPGDIDYKSIGQFSTFMLGTLNTKQDIQKVKARLESIAPQEIDVIEQGIPALKKGEFLVLSPDAFDKVQELKVRWLVTQHTVISEEKLAELINPKYLELYAPQPDPEDETATEADEDAAAEEDAPQISPELGEDEVLKIETQLYERDLEKKVKPHLAGCMMKAETFEGAEFHYLPMAMVDLIFFKKRGFFKKKTEEIHAKLYLDLKTNEIQHIEKKQFVFSTVLDSDPHAIQDLDDIAEINMVQRETVDFDFSTIDEDSLDVTALTHMMERKYPIKVNTIQLALFPLWECTLKHKKTEETRIVKLDAIFGNLVECEL